MSHEWAWIWPSRRRVEVVGQIGKALGWVRVLGQDRVAFFSRRCSGAGNAMLRGEKGGESGRW